MINILSRSLLVTFLTAIAWTLPAQQPVIKEYKGRYVNGMSHPAEADYEYYEHRVTGKHIMHGRFKYTVRDTEREEKFQQNFRGMYVDGQKTGSWSYRTSMNDYQRDDNGEFWTGNVTLIAAYDKGLPQGRWEYSWSMKSRRKETADGVTKWSRFTETRKVNITVTFEKGMLIDSVRVTDTHGTSLFGIFDRKGFFHQDWVYLSDTTEEISGYNHGVLLLHTYRRHDAERFEIEEDYSGNRAKQSQLATALSGGPAALAGLSFSSDTSSVFTARKHPFVELVIDRIYSDRDFLYRYIPGDRLFRFDDTRKLHRPFLEGGYLVTFNVKLSASEESKFLMVKQLRADIEDLEWKTSMVSDGRKLPPTLRNSADMVTRNNEVAEDYQYLATRIAEAARVADGISSASSCRYFSEVSQVVNGKMNKAAAFDAIISELEKLRRSSAGIYEQIRKYKG